MAILGGLEVCNQENIFPLWVEADSTTALAIIKSDQNIWSMRHLLNQIQVFVHNKAVNFSHVFSEGNIDADALSNIGWDNKT